MLQTRTSTGSNRQINSFVRRFTILDSGQYFKHCIGKMETVKDKFQCDFCPKSFRQKYNLDAHKTFIHANNVHISEKKKELMNLVCKICDFKVSSARYLSLHSRVHKKSDGISCKACGLAFETPYDRRKHQCEQRTKQCSICENEVVNLKHHMKTVHEDNASFDCEFCDFVCTTSRYMKTHINRVHLKLAKTIECEYCGTKLSSNQSLKIHIASQHSSDELQCPTCGCEFKTKTERSLKYHTMIQHTDRFKPMECSICKITLKNKFSLKNHMNETENSFQCMTASYILCD